METASAIVVSAGPESDLPLVEEADNLSASVFRPADLDKIAGLTADELHQELVGGFINGVENSIWLEALVIDARRRMANGEPVGGHTTWTGYVDEYFRRENESIETTLRRLRRLLRDVEHAAKKFKNKRPKAKTNAVIVEESLIRDGETKAKEAYRRGKAEAYTEVAYKALANNEALDKETKDGLLKFVGEANHSSDATATYYAFRRKSDGNVWNRYRFVAELQDAFAFDEVEDMTRVIRAEKRFFNRSHKHEKNPPKFSAENYEWVKVQAAYTLTPVSTPVQPEPENDGTKTRRMKKVPTTPLG
jgi:hypothetical protein